MAGNTTRPNVFSKSVTTDSQRSIVSVGSRNLNFLILEASHEEH